MITNNGTVVNHIPPVQPQTVVVTVVVTATPMPTAPPKIFHVYKSTKPIISTITPTPSAIPTVHAVPTKAVRHPRVIVTPKPSPVAVIGSTIKSLLHFLSFGLL